MLNNMHRKRIISKRTKNINDIYQLTKNNNTIIYRNNKLISVSSLRSSTNESVRINQSQSNTVFLYIIAKMNNKHKGGDQVPKSAPPGCTQIILPPPCDEKNAINRGTVCGNATFASSNSVPRHSAPGPSQVAPARDGAAAAAAEAAADTLLAAHNVGALPRRMQRT